jgi:peptidoglycan-associated lipoprotein
MKKILNILFIITLVILLTFAFSCRSRKQVRTTPQPPIQEPSETEDLKDTEEVKPKVSEWETGKVEKKDLTPADYNESGVLEDIHFDFDRYDIRPDAREILIRNAEWLKSHLDIHVLIEGHCDERGTNEYNMALGERRANAAKNYLISLGVSSHRMRSISYGEEMPIDPGHNEIAWAKNRRAHFLITAKD